MKIQMLKGLIVLSLLVNCFSEDIFACEKSFLSEGSLYSPVNDRTDIVQKFGDEVSGQYCGESTGAAFVPLTLGKSVISVGDGEVVYIGPLWRKGKNIGRGENAIIISHGDFYSVYSHNESASVKKGQCVKGAQTIGVIGQAGAATEPMVFLEIVKKPNSQGTGGVKFSGVWHWPFGQNVNSFCDAYLDPLPYLGL